MNQYERRALSGIREEEGKLIGYAAVFGTLSHDLGGIREVIEPGAFSRTLTANPDVRALIDHEPKLVLGRTTAGTLKLEQDAHGLRVEITPPNTTAANDLLESVRRGDVSGMSFAFRVPDRKNGQRIDYSGDVPVRHLLDVDLKEVSVVTFPAYEDASVALRALEQLDPAYFHRMRLQLEERS